MLLLQIVWPDGTVARFHGGREVELDLRKAIRDEIMKRGVGLWRTEAHVAKDIDDGIKAAIEAFKSTALPALLEIR